MGQVRPKPATLPPAVVTVTTGGGLPSRETPTPTCGGDEESDPFDLPQTAAATVRVPVDLAP